MRQINNSKNNLNNDIIFIFDGYPNGWSTLVSPKRALIKRVQSK